MLHDKETQFIVCMSLLQELPCWVAPSAFNISSRVSSFRPFPRGPRGFLSHLSTFSFLVHWVPKLKYAPLIKFVLSSLSALRTRKALILDFG